MWTFRGQKRPAFALAPNDGQESVWDYPRPPKLVVCERPIQIVGNDRVIASTRRALRLLETQEFDCVLSDIVMPGLSGIELVRLIREEKDADTLPIVLVTGTFVSSKQSIWWIVFLEPNLSSYLVMTTWPGLATSMLFSVK